ncbi:MAG TPA: FkbM family methyltransferase [Candidatus Solibacter sp.]|jgi:FkbM family methyltransferase
MNTPSQQSTVAPPDVIQGPPRAGFLKWLRARAGNCLAILLHGSPLGRFRMLTTYVRISFKVKLLVDILKLRIDEEKVFSQTICFADYNTFLILFEEIFLTSVYHFRTENSAPSILDAGANTGMSVAYFKTIYPDCRIIAFEPDPANFKLLGKNVTRNGWANVELHNVALHRRDAELDFYDYNDRPGALSNGFWRPSEAGPAKKVITVRAVPLSRHVEEPIDMLKMDIEGSEHDVLEDLVESGKLSAIRRITMEYHHHVQRHDDRLGKLLCRLEDAGFGYHICAPLALPFPQEETQNFMLRAYR